MPLTFTDDPLLAMLVREKVLAPADADALRAWHDADGGAGESMVEFLTRQNILDRSARRAIDLNLKGYVGSIDLASIWPAGKLEDIRRRFERAGTTQIDAPRTTHSAVPIFSTMEAGSLDSIDTPPTFERPSIGSRVGRCLLTELLAEGGGGIVYRALHQGLNIPVAVKLLSTARARTDFRKRLQSEARSLAQLDHPNVVRVLDHDDSDPPHLVLEYVDGPNLADLIRQAGAIRYDRALSIIRQATEGLQAAEQIGILHRDVKPANILMTRRGVAKVADFGLAVPTTGQNSAVPLGLSGTLPFMSEEQLVCSPTIDSRADIYSLGVTFYQAVTGRLPFRARTCHELVAEIRSGRFEPPHNFVPGLTPDVSHVILRMMAHAPADRYPGYADLLADLTELAHRAKEGGNR
ncbi:MAG: serine/threonine protein kinase [Gemmataceae bacterium]|nr:serine/threonine protein kinase [Gemmataceae bacterium]